MLATSVKPSVSRSSQRASRSPLRGMVAKFAYTIIMPDTPLSDINNNIKPAHQSHFFTSLFGTMSSFGLVVLRLDIWGVENRPVFSRAKSSISYGVSFLDAPALM